MKPFPTRIDLASDAFATNRRDMLALVERLNDLNGRAARLSEKRKDRFAERGQITPRERLSRLLDPGMPFVEIGNMAGYMMDDLGPDKTVPGANVIIGIGFVAGVRSMVVVDDSGLNAGAMTAPGGTKMLRAQAIALQNKLPFIHLVESAGANLMKYTVEFFVSGGAVFYNLARLSAAGIPVITILHGPSTAGGAYMPGMSDYVIAVRGRGKAFLAGPALLQAATGEVATEEELGGAEMHATVTGVAEYLAENDIEGIEICRELVERLNWNRRCARVASTGGREPLYDAEELLGVVPVDYRKPYDVREVVTRIVDGSAFLDFKPGYGVSTICLQAEIYGQACGIIGNNGPIDPEGAAKAGQFIQLCEQADAPLIFLQNITGYMVGTAYERAGMIKHGSKMIQAMSNVAVPRITLMIGASFGAGNYGMCGRGYDPDFLFSWPNAKTGVMGGEQAARTMSLVAEAAARRKGEAVDRAAQAEEERRLIEHFDSQSDAFYTSGRGLDDGIIDPRHSRKLLGFLLDTCMEARARTLSPNNFGVARF
jgi:geranyl-CoA carboxylase beta subunit